MPFEAFASSSMSRRGASFVSTCQLILWMAAVQKRQSYKPGTNNEVVQCGWGFLCHSWLGVFKLVLRLKFVRNFDRSGEDMSSQS